MARVVRRIANASPLILLGKIGRPDLLRAGVPEAVVPSAVLEEVGGHGTDRVTVQEIADASWISIAPPVPISSPVQAWDLGDGETAVLALALGHRDCEAVLDDREAKRCAQSLGVPTRGTVGLVLLAKQLNRVPAARPLVSQLKHTGLYITDHFINQALALVGE
jgi:predicted nucleic acid-binding protein